MPICTLYTRCVWGRTARAFALFAIVVGGCAEPDVGECTFQCEDGERCPLGLRCGGDGYCHGDDDLEHCALECPGCVAGTYNIMFVSSRFYVPGSLGGLAGADAECQRLAGAAELPGEYRAWLSTSTVDAGSRLVSAAGAAANGWIRPDRRPFAVSLDALANNEILYPPRIDEGGQDLGSDQTVLVATGTLPAGDVAPDFTAGDWESPDIGYMAGDAVTTTASWTASLTPGPMPARIYCFGVDHDRPLELEPVEGRLAFSSRDVFRPSSLAAADAQCQSDAEFDGLEGSYVALLATSSAAASSRFDLTGPNWIRTDGIPWLPGPAALERGQYLTALNVDSGGNYLAPGSNWVWTGSDDPATAAGLLNCDDWTSAAASERSSIGQNHYSNALLFDDGESKPCDFEFPRLYCLQE